jgi:hypothetical protein
MNHVFIGRPIGKVDSATMEVNGTLTNFGPGKLYHARVAEIADAIGTGAIDGDVYADGEVYADPDSVEKFFAAAVA